MFVGKASIKRHQGLLSWLEDRKMEKIGFSLLNFLIGYVVITWIGFLHTVFNIKVLHMKSMKESGGKGKGLGEAYNKTKPWHPLYNLIILPIFAYMYFKGLDTVTLSNAVVTSILWGTFAIVIDLVGWGCRTK